MTYVIEVTYHPTRSQYYAGQPGSVVRYAAAGPEDIRRRYRSLGYCLDIRSLRSYTIDGVPRISWDLQTNTWTEHRAIGTGTDPRERAVQLVLEQVQVVPSGCWEYQGFLDSGGYGRLTHRSQHFMTHRVVWEMFVGPIPDGLHIDHLCKNRRCCCTDHLEPVTPQENSRRGARGVRIERIATRHHGRTRCRNGHEYTEENTFVTPEGGATCRQCGKDARARYAERLKAERHAALLLQIEEAA